MAKSLDIIDPKKELHNEPEEREEEREPQVRATEHREEGSGGLFYLIIGIIAVIVSAALALYILLKDNDPQKSSGTSVATTTPTPAQTATPAATSTASTVAATETATTVASTFKYNNEQIRIANGNGKEGEANRIKTLLEGKGYKIASTGNASKTYDTSIVYFKTGKDKLAEALKTDLTGQYAFTTENSDSIVGSYDAVVVLGAK